MTPGENSYAGREQARVKHAVLRGYLQRLAFKVGNFRPNTTLNYIDGFSGPWDAVADGHADSSPVIAMRELAEARDALATLPTPKRMVVRAMFVERDAAAFEHLKTICERAPIEAMPHHGQFEAYIDAAARFAAHGPNPFAFIFIDPTGWTGFGLKRIKPLLQVNPSEVLINFMWGHIGRFIDDEGSSAEASFDDLLGGDATSYRARWKGLKGLDREDEVVRTYCERVREVGGFAHCVSTVVVKPWNDSTHYHLVFATRSLKGLTTFRETEREAMSLQQTARAEAKQRKRESGGQLELLGPTEMDSDYLTELCTRYQRKAHEAVDVALSKGGEIPYDALVATALSCPMTSERELKAWLDDLRKAGRIELLGLAPRARVPKVGENHRIRQLK